MNNSSVKIHAAKIKLLLRNYLPPRLFGVARPYRLEKS